VGATSVQKYYEVCDLTFDQQVLLWCLRKLIGGQGDRTTSTAPLCKLLGPAFYEEGAHGMLALAHSLCGVGNARTTPYNVGDLAERRLTKDEAVVVDAFTLCKTNKWLAGLSVLVDSQKTLLNPQVMDALKALAHTFARAERAAAYVRIDELDNIGGPHVEQVTELDRAERAVIDGLRHWVQVHQRGSRSNENPEAKGSITHPQAIACMQRVIHNTATASFRTVDIRCPKCRALSPDEARIIHAVALGQRELEADIAGILSSWLPDAAVRLTAPAVVGLAHALRGERNLLPLRDWQFDQLERKQNVRPVPIERETGEHRRVLH